MVFDTTQPTDTTKVRNLGIVIRPNWQAIETGDSTFKPQALNLDNRTPIAPANNPTAIADTYILYCKDDVGGNPELFGIDETSVVSQFTSADFTLAQNGHGVIPPGFLINWGRATIPSGSSTVAVTFTRNFNAAPWIIHVTPYVNPVTGGGANAREIGADTFTTTGFNARLFNGNTTQNTLVGWLAIGELA